MPFEHLVLNDGSRIPSIAYGSSGIPLDQTPSEIDMAFDVGFEHIDTAQCTLSFILRLLLFLLLLLPALLDAR